ncbi:MAG: thioredoxin-like domain-containing protein [Gammaproteobacteria bacterium]|nr:thioredoxin-like domain-containing protein [Gammaproteobacteria bacterium]
MYTTLKWLGLILLFGVIMSWHSQSHYNDTVESIFTAASQSERILKAPIKDFSGQEFALSDLQGKPILLDFWASWCPPCRASMPELENMQEQFGDKLTILAVNVMESPKDGIQYVLENPYELTFVHSRKLADIFNIKVLPTKILLNSKGEVIWANTGHIPFLTHQWLENQLE